MIWKYERDGHCLICSKRCPDKTSSASSGWDWFGGYLGLTVHFCPEHKIGELRGRLLAIGEKTPDIWTTDEREFVRKFKIEIEKVESAARYLEQQRNKKS